MLDRRRQAARNDDDDDDDDDDVNILHFISNSPIGLLALLLAYFRQPFEASASREDQMPICVNEIKLSLEAAERASLGPLK